MNKDKSFGLDGIVLEFYETFWNIMEPKYVVIIQESIFKG